MAERVTKATFEKVFKRDGERCVFCKSYIALQLHHINGRGVGKTDNADNCVIKTAAENGIYLEEIEI